VEDDTMKDIDPASFVVRADHAGGGAVIMYRGQVVLHIAKSGKMFYRRSPQMELPHNFRNDFMR
jgi:demethoxyubiquinone hydroxylase (CLK1/Coq7/Cat5 family)